MSSPIYIFTDWFWPAYKAGGPVQSLLNLCAALDDTSKVHVITGSSDLGEKTTMKDIAVNTWNEVLLPGMDKKVNVWYGKGKWSLPSLGMGKEEKIYYLNGIYSFHYFLKPLLFLKGKTRGRRLVVCPRGMLQKGALSVKPLKKRFYILALKHSGLLARAVWHATNKEEEIDIKREFGVKTKVIVAPNIPKKPLKRWEAASKKQGSLRLVFISLITEKKGLDTLLEVLRHTSEGVNLDIYGPVKDRRYWAICKEKLHQLKGRAQYKGSLFPLQVQETFSKYDASVLLTRGENFGHALYESMSAGRPVITSRFTPWNNLEQQQAGWNIDITEKQKIVEVINRITDMNKSEFEVFCWGAHKTALAYYNSLDPLTLYKPLFSRTGI